jgi:hypothetical protein
MVGQAGQMAKLNSRPFSTTVRSPTVKDMEL